MHNKSPIYPNPARFQTRIVSLRQLNFQDLGMMGFLSQMGPAFSKLLDDVEDWTAYHPPEILPNGDIIIRKKTPEERGTPQAPEQGEDGGQIDI